MNPPTVPHPRDIDKGMHGDDVIAVKHALSRAGFLPWGHFTPVWDDAIMAAIQPFQNAHQVPPGPGQYGPKTHAALVASHRKGSTTEWAYDAHAIALMTKFAAKFAAGPMVAGVRGAVLAEAARLYEHRFDIAYSENRPITLHRPPFVPPFLDCASFITFCYFVAGAPDPNGPDAHGMTYTGNGNTTTLHAHGMACTTQELQGGDLVFYANPDHVTLYDHDGMVYSQGGPPHPGGPPEMRREHFDYRPVTGCRHHDL